MLCAPLIIFSCTAGARKTNKFIETAKIYPAKIISTNSHEEWDEGVRETFYRIEYRVFCDGEVLGKRLRFSTALGWHRKDKGALFDYYKNRKYMFVLYKPKKKKTFPVRLYKKGDA